MQPPVELFHLALFRSDAQKNQVLTRKGPSCGTLAGRFIFANHDDSLSIQRILIISEHKDSIVGEGDHEGFDVELGKKELVLQLGEETRVVVGIGVVERILHIDREVNIADLEGDLVVGLDALDRSVHQLGPT